MDVLEAEGKEVLETIILKQEIEQLYRAYEACLKETEKIVLRTGTGCLAERNRRSGRLPPDLGFRVLM